MRISGNSPASTPNVTQTFVEPSEASRRSDPSTPVTGSSFSQDASAPSSPVLSGLQQPGVRTQHRLGAENIILSPLTTAELQLIEQNFRTSSRNPLDQILAETITRNQNNMATEPIGVCMFGSIIGLGLAAEGMKNISLGEQININVFLLMDEYFALFSAITTQSSAGPLARDKVLQCFEAFQKRHDFVAAAAEHCGDANLKLKFDFFDLAYRRMRQKYAL